MATTYAELQTEVADFLNRDDLTSVLPTFISLAEGQLNRDVRDWRMEQRSEAIADDRFLTLPDDWIETIRVQVGLTEAPLQLMSRDEMHAQRAKSGDTAGTPCYYSHVAGELELYPTPDGEYSLTLHYVQKIPDLATNSTNWLLTNAPDIYLYATLIQAAHYLRDGERLATWTQLYQASIMGLNTQSKRATESGTGLKMTIRSY